MIDIEIIGIKKDNGNHESPFEAVQDYRWIQHSTGNSAITSRMTVVGWLDNGIDGVSVSAYVQRVNPRADCFVNVNGAGTRFLQTRLDATENNNLLTLPEC